MSGDPIPLLGSTYFSQGFSSVAQTNRRLKPVRLLC